MKIAFDATVLHGQKSGVGYYCQDLLRSLVKGDNADEYFVFSHIPVPPDVIEQTERITFSDRGFSNVRAFYLHFLLPRLLREAQPDLVHYTNFLGPFYDSHPYVVTIHDMSLQRLAGYHPIAKRVYTKRLIPRVARRARLIITNSEYSKWDIVKYLGIPESRIRVTPLAASPLFRQYAEVDYRPVVRSYHIERPYFAYVGNLEPRKNLERLLEAFQSIRDRGFDLVIAGNSWFQGHRVFEKARELGLEEQVHFLGYVPRAHLPAIISGATAFVYPSLLEGFGVPVVEAMSCGCPVITSNNSSLREITGGAALLVDPTNVGEIADAMIGIGEQSSLSETLRQKSLAQASRFSWERTAEWTRHAYIEAFDADIRPRPSVTQESQPPDDEDLRRAIERTIDYANQFDYPLTLPELRERLFSVKTDEASLARTLEAMDLSWDGKYVNSEPGRLVRRRDRETASDHVIGLSWPHMRTVASVPFVRMIAFSGATAHRNMGDEDLDLFAVIEDGKLWAVLLAVTIWAKLKGLRKNICLNYIVSDRALPLFEVDPFTAQQAAALKPFFGKRVYDRFIDVNPFIQRHFPNFERAIHRDQYDEIPEPGLKKVFETVLRWGPIQVLDRISEWVLGSYLQAKERDAQTNGRSELLLGRRWIKLHLQGHRRATLDRFGRQSPSSSVAHAVSGTLAPPANQRQEQNAQVQRQ